jgi:hypothetical protein
MRTSIILTLVLALGMAFAVPSFSNSPGPERVKLYTGTYGSNQFVWGYAPAGSPLDAWVGHSNLPQALMDNAAAGDSANVYVLAGYNASSAAYLFRHAVGGTTWTTLTAPPVYITNGGCAVIGDTLYYCSGYSYTAGACIDTLLKYSISGGTWSAASGPYTSGTTYNWQPFILACAGKLYYISGCNQPGATDPTTNVWCYTPGAGWAQVASMNTGRVFASGWTYHDTIWVAGGNVNNSGITSTEFYDPVADTWVVNSSTFPVLPSAIWGSASGVNSGSGWATGWIAGGVGPASALQDTIYYFDHVTHSWTLTDGMYLIVYRAAGWGNGDGKAVIYGGSTGGFTPVTTCQYERESPPLDHDVSMVAIVKPPANMSQDSVNPIGTVKNDGSNPESNISVTCWIDSLGTRVYTGTDTLIGPLAVGATVSDTFPTAWHSGPAGAHYTVTMFTELAGDVNPDNDTIVGSTQITGAVFSDTIHVGRLAGGAPTIDGEINPWEWRAAIQYDISDIAGRGGSGSQPVGSVYAYYLYDSTAGFMYFAADCPKYIGRVDYDQVGPYMDEDNSKTWSTDSSEGNYWIEYLGGDSVIYRALLDVTPNIWLYGSVPGAVSVSSTASGHLQFETKIPLGAGKYELKVAPGDTVGYFQYVAVSGGTVYPGWWPQTLQNANWANPQYYGTMIFETEVGVQESPSARFALYKASPSIVREQAHISYYVAGRSNVSLGVYDVTGTLVKTLASGPANPGVSTATWNRTDNLGRSVANGTYFYRLAVDGKSVSSKAIVLK